MAARTATAAILAVAITPAMPLTPVIAQPLVTSGEWLDATGAYSYCSQSTATTVVCDHWASAGSDQAATSTCTTESAELGPIAIIGACQVSLTGVTSGAGKEVTDGFAPGCQTLGFGTATLTFSDSTGVDYPPVSVTIANQGGVAEFSGTAVNTAGVVIAHAEGKFTLACGSPTEVARGTFQGTYRTA